MRIECLIPFMDGSMLKWQENGHFIGVGSGMLYSGLKLKRGCHLLSLNEDKKFPLDCNQFCLCFSPFSLSLRDGTGCRRFFLAWRHTS